MTPENAEFWIAVIKRPKQEPEYCTWTLRKEEIDAKMAAWDLERQRYILRIAKVKLVEVE